MKAHGLTVCLLLTIAHTTYGQLSDGVEAPAQALADPSSNSDDRLTFLSEQLTTVEASIEAVNEALVAAGRKVVSSQSKAASVEQNNIRLDSLGGGPVRWKDFYGTVARDFYFDDKGKAIRRPKQFDYIYRANDQRVKKAKTDAAAAGKKIDVLLAQRQALEDEQSKLWATISLESIQNRGIPQRSIYHWCLVTKRPQGNADPFDAPRVKALQAGVVLLRTVDGAASEAIKGLRPDQPAKLQNVVYTSLRDAVEKSRTPAEGEIILSRDTVGAGTTDGKQIASLLERFKGLQSQAQNFCDAYGAIDSKPSAEESTQQDARGRLQRALWGFAVATAQLDQALTTLGQEWQIDGDVGNKLEVAAFEMSDLPKFSPSPATPSPQFDLSKLREIKIRKEQKRGKKNQKMQWGSHAVIHKDGVAYVRRNDGSQTPLTLEGNKLTWEGPQGAPMVVDIDRRSTDKGQDVKLSFAD